MTSQQQYSKQQAETADNLRTIMRAKPAELKPLALPDVDAVVEQVARVMPAGNVPGLILNGLARLSERRITLTNVRSDINQLFKGTEQALDGAVYGAFFAGPAAVIWGYQKLLQLAGKDPEDAFPEGTWQFYVDYALREDTARHTNETNGFDARLAHHQITLSPVDRITAWVMAAITLLHQYPELLLNEWRERVYTSILRDLTYALPTTDHYVRIYREWEKQRPYRRGPDAHEKESYPAYRKRKFDRYLENAMRTLPMDLAKQWVDRVRQAKETSLSAYQQQMSILAYLDPGPYGEVRTPLSLSQTQVGIIFHGRYYLLPVCERGFMRPPSATLVRAQIAALLAWATDERPAQGLTILANMRRAAFPNVLSKVSANLRRDLTALRFAPILLNFDQRPRDLPLSELRQTERGVGDHPLTLFDTGESMVFDQSHIFFDGAWGAAFAEIFTNEALSWAVYLSKFPDPAPSTATPQPLALTLAPEDVTLVKEALHTIPEVCVENNTLNLKALLALRRMFQFRSDRLQLTVNDLLVLYRAIHAITYRPEPELLAAIQALPEAESILAELEPEQVNPAILIPVDASLGSPRDRVHPLNIEMPLREFDFINLHKQALAALLQYQTGGGDRSKAYKEFDAVQRRYLTVLASLGIWLRAFKESAIMGKTSSISTIKMLAHLPTSMQRWLDRSLSDKFDVLNDLIKGREVFSNVGEVVRDSTLRRFSSAKDDNDKKALVWGVLTDAQGVVHITLRDFRPYVRLLERLGQRALAKKVAQAYLDAYVAGFNAYVQDLHHITQFSRETQLEREPRP